MSRINLIIVLLGTTAVWLFALSHIPKKALWAIGALFLLGACVRTYRGVSEREYFKGVGFKPPA